MKGGTGVEHDGGMPSFIYSTLTWRIFKATDQSVMFYFAFIAILHVSESINNINKKWHAINRQAGKRNYAPASLTEKKSHSLYLLTCPDVENASFGDGCLITSF